MALAAAAFRLAPYHAGDGGATEDVLKRLTDSADLYLLLRRHYDVDGTTRV